MVMRSSTSLPFDMPELEEPTFPERVIDLSACGGCDDGRTMNTEAFERAIAKCAGEGGGTVQVGPGRGYGGRGHRRC